MTNEKPLKEKKVSLRLPKQRCLQADTRGAALMHGRGDELEEKREPGGRDQREIIFLLFFPPIKEGVLVGKCSAQHA